VIRSKPGNSCVIALTSVVTAILKYFSF